MRRSTNLNSWWALLLTLAIGGGVGRVDGGEPDGMRGSPLHVSDSDFRTDSPTFSPFQPHPPGQVTFRLSDLDPPVADATTEFIQEVAAQPAAHRTADANWESSTFDAVWDESQYHADDPSTGSWPTNSWPTNSRPAAVDSGRGRTNLDPAGNVSQTSVLIYDSGDGMFNYQLDGRVFIDAAFYNDNKNALSSGAEIRQGRVSIKARLWYDWPCEFDVNFSDNEASIKDAWIGYAGFPSRLIRVGNFKEPFSLEEMMSRRYLTFMERALPNVFVPSRHIGVGYSQWGERWQFGTGFFGQEAGDTDAGQSQSYGTSGRVTVAPIFEERKMLHLGCSLGMRTPEADAEGPNRVRFRTLPETDISRIFFLNTGRIRDVDHYTLWGVEVAAVLHALAFQAEYIGTNVNRMNGSVDADFSGAYAQLSWFLTGEARPYIPQFGEFGPILSNRRGGVWEFALRYSATNLNDLNANVQGGKENIVTLGLNWYINPNIRVMLNYAVVDNDQHADDNGDVVGSDRFEYLQTRFQASF